MVIAHKITPSSPHPLNVAQVQQLLTLTKKTGFWDVFARNLFLTENNTITTIDTERRGLYKHRARKSRWRFFGEELINRYGYEESVLI